MQHPAEHYEDQIEAMVSMLDGSDHEAKAEMLALCQAYASLAVAAAITAGQQIEAGAFAVIPRAGVEVIARAVFAHDGPEADAAASWIRKALDDAGS